MKQKGQYIYRANHDQHADYPIGQSIIYTGEIKAILYIQAHRTSLFLALWGKITADSLSVSESFLLLLGFLVIFTPLYWACHFFNLR